MKRLADVEALIGVPLVGPPGGPLWTNRYTGGKNNRLSESSGRWGEGIGDELNKTLQFVST